MLPFHAMAAYDCNVAVGAVLVCAKGNVNVLHSGLASTPCHALLLASRLSGSMVRVFGSNAGCLVKFIYSA
jgi:hypothetical protein